MSVLIKNIIPLGYRIKAKIMTREENFMQQAILLSQQGMLNNEGGPFGCVVVKNNIIIGKGNNKVILNNDPTAHAEIIAIRDACNFLKDFQLEGCEIYTSCEPCPMCLGAIYWARPSIIYYANTRMDAAAAGFDDALIYKEISAEIGERKIPMKALPNKAALKIFLDWKTKIDKTNY